MQPAATVYLATNTVNGHQYVGVTRFTVEHRWNQHKTNAKGRFHKTYLYSALAKYGWDVFTVEPVASVLIASRASEVERAIIQRLAPIYNQTNGGEITTGRKHTPEIVARIAAKNTGLKRTEAQRLASSARAKARYAADPKYLEMAVNTLHRVRALVDEMKRTKAAGESARNRVWTPEMRAKLSASCMGRRYGREIIDRMRESKNKPVECIETGIVYPSMLAAAAATGVSVTSVSRICLGKRNSANGLRFRAISP